MLSLKGCSIHLDQPGKKYMPGQTMNGHIMVQFNEPVKMRGLKIEFIGSAHVSWSESKQVRDSEGKSRTVTEHFTANEEYYSTKFYLVGSSNGDITIPTGSYNYPFKFLVPTNIPSSFEGQHGHIRHKIDVVMDRPWKFDKSTFITFEVIPAPMTMHLTNQQPHKLELEKTFCCFCCASGPLSLILSLPYTTFAPGKNIPFIIDCDNASNVKVNNIVLKIIKIVKFHARHPHSKTKENRITINKISVGSVSTGETKTLREELIIPNIELFDIDTCRIMDLYYVLEVEAKVSGTHTNLSGKVPINLRNEGPITQIGFDSSSVQYPPPPPYSSEMMPPPVMYPPNPQMMPQPVPYPPNPQMMPPQIPYPPNPQMMSPNSAYPEKSGFDQMPSLPNAIPPYPAYDTAPAYIQQPSAPPNL